MKTPVNIILLGDDESCDAVAIQVFEALDEVVEGDLLFRRELDGRVDLSWVPSKRHVSGFCGTKGLTVLRRKKTTLAALCSSRWRVFAMGVAS